MSATVMLNPGQVHRKPVGNQRSFTDMQQPGPAHQQPQYHDSYSRPRAPSTSPTPSPVYSGQAHPPPAQYPNSTRLSSASSTTGSAAFQGGGVQRMPTNSSMPRRSTSSRSTTGAAASATSYVALMRKQKATVWCDRAQHEDPRILAKHREDKMRAAREVAGGRHHGNRVSTGSSNPGYNSGLRSKIRHPGAPKAHTYLGGANMSGAGVPIRLSATEMDENDSDESGRQHNKRSGSGRSSNGSGVGHTNSRLNSTLGRSNDSTPPNDSSPANSMGYVAEEQTPVPTQANMNASDYFEGAAGDDAAEEQRFGGIGVLPPSKPRTEQDLKREEDLKRRGSVDDRAMTMSGQRLFVANPDLSD